MKAIETKYLPATNCRGSRIKAMAEGVKPLTIPYPHDAHHDAIHAQAALALARRMGWKGTLVSGGRGEVFCFLDSDHYDI